MKAWFVGIYLNIWSCSVLNVHKDKRFSPDLSSWRFSWSCRHTRSHTTTTPEAETWWGPDGSCCWGDPGKKKRTKVWHLFFLREHVLSKMLCRLIICSLCFYSGSLETQETTWGFKILLDSVFKDVRVWSFYFRKQTLTVLPTVWTL